jgi:hypothetical protein
MTQKERKIKQLKAKLAQLIRRQIMLPGGISRHWNVCGKPNCRCKDPKHPVKHGPYYQLSFTLEGRSSSFFVKEKDLLRARQLTQHHRMFRKLSTALIQGYVKLLRQQGFSRS